MPEISVLDLSKKIRSGEISGVYYIYGKDVSAVEAGTKSIFKKLIGKNYANDINRVDGGNIDISMLCDMLEQNSMFSQYNAVLINDLNAEELSADQLKALIKTVEDIPENTVAVFNITGISITNAKNKITTKNKKLMDAVAKNGVVCNCQLKTAAALGKALCDRAKKLGCIISKKNAERIAVECLLNTLTAYSEIDKLCDYCQEGEITSEMIDMLVSGQIETDAFKLAAAVTSMNARLAFTILNNLIDTHTEPIAIISAVSRSFVDLYRARAAMTVGKYQADIIADFSYKGREFVVNNAYRDCRRISVEGMRRCIEILRSAERKLKSSSLDGGIMLEKTVAEMLIAVRQ